MSFENLSLSAFTEAVKLNLQKQNIETNIQKNILDNISVYFNNANGVDNDMTTLNEAEYNKANADIETKIAELKQKAQSVGEKKPIGLGNGEREGLETEMQDFISKFEGAKYKSHAKFNNVGQFMYKGERIVIIKHNDNKYELVRQHPTEQQTLETSEYTSLNELYQEMSKDDYGWGRDTFRPNDPRGFSMRDLMFYDAGGKLVYRAPK